MNQVQFPAQLTKIETRTDNSIKVIIETQELNGEDMATLFGYRNTLGYVTFTPNQTDAIEVPKDNARYDGISPSQRMRSILYKLWMDGGKTKFDTFEQYYAVNMERIINQLKDKL